MLAHITLATRDVARSVAFFRETLGWLPVARPANIDMTAAWLTIGPELELHLIQVPDFEPSPFEQEFGRHIAVTYPRVQFSQLKQRLQARGAVLIGPLAKRRSHGSSFAIPMDMSSRSWKKITTSPGRLSNRINQSRPTPSESATRLM